MTDPHVSTPAVPWHGEEPPKRILAIRLQALGDVVITLPYLRSLRRSLPGTDIDFLTRQEDGSIPRALALFRSVEQLGGGRSERRQLLSTPLRAPRLLAHRYDVVLDLQNNRVSRTIRRLAHPRAWAQFDRESPVPTKNSVLAAIIELNNVCE